MNGIGNLTLHSAVPTSVLPVMITTFLLATGATVGNLILLTAIYRDPYRNLRTASSMLVANLAFCDILVGVIAGYGLFAYELCVYVRRPMAEYVRDGILVSSSVVLVCGVCTVVVMAIDRYLAVISPFSYAATVTSRRVCIALMSIWSYALLINLLLFLVLPKRLGGFLASHLHVSFPAAILSKTYIKMIREVQRHNNKWKAGRILRFSTVKLPTKFSFSLNSERERKLSSTILLIMTSFGLSFLPLYVALNIQYLWNESVSFPWCYTLLEISLLIVISNSFFNPVVYALRVPKFRKAVRNVLGLRDNIVNVLISALWTINVHGRSS